MDPKDRRAALRLLDYNLFLVTTRSRDGSEVHGFLGSWVTQASFAPPLVVLAVRADSRGNALIRESGVFVLNVLARDQKQLAAAFLKDPAASGDRIGGLAFVRGETGAPVFPELAGHVECTVRQVVEGGDHTVFLGEVVAASARGAGALRTSDAGWTYAG